jgi:hypothetical protein
MDYVTCLGGGGGAAQAASLAAATSAELERLDWRLAIGEVSMNLRREVADKASREEMYSAVRAEVERLDQRLSVSPYSPMHTPDLSSVGVMLIICLTTIMLVVHLLQHVQKAVDGAASAEGISRVDGELTALKHKVAGELIGAR